MPAINIAALPASPINEAASQAAQAAAQRNYPGRVLRMDVRPMNELSRTVAVCQAEIDDYGTDAQSFVTYFIAGQDGRYAYGPSWGHTVNAFIAEQGNGHSGYVAAPVA